MRLVVEVERKDEAFLADCNVIRYLPTLSRWYQGGIALLRHLSESHQVRVTSLVSTSAKETSDQRRRHKFIWMPSSTIPFIAFFLFVVTLLAEPVQYCHGDFCVVMAMYQNQSTPAPTHDLHLSMTPARIRPRSKAES
ncbi:hypothetical protein L249_8418 [Ophiocordyceps polyrhachis-furcata BCC 54312]|uniref:Uncharacterized protein n=1 Tax=Ophiocordyceps polyrhachis-furcata BCC 54312 TaxID=1330021 RepID=A0A367L6S8_9HYPO|nr:hypothetical protein L249_8418 [Ophiocordyceps polyrhachis-furcata BCC 54312]